MCVVGLRDGSPGLWSWRGLYRTPWPSLLHPQRPHLENKSYAQWLLVLCLYSSITNVRLMPTYPHFGVSLGNFESHVSQGPTSNICVIV